MPQRLMDQNGAAWTEDQLSWFTSWTSKNKVDPEKGTVLRGDPLPEGFTFEEYQAHDSDCVMFGLYPMSGYQLELLGNTGPSRKQRRQGQHDAHNEGTDSMKMVAKSLKIVKTVPCKDGEGKEHEVGGLLDNNDEQVGRKVDKNTILGLPGWQILEITDHIELVKVQQEKSAKN